MTNIKGKIVISYAVARGDAKSLMKPISEATDSVPFFQIYLPGQLPGASSEATALLPKAIILNPDLCSPKELQEFLSKLITRPG
jgi:hypothetical protein